MRRLLIALAVVSACSRPTGPSDDLRVATSTSPSPATVGEAVAVDITVTNVGSRSWRVTVNNCPRPFVITDQAGTVVAGPYGQRCLTVLSMTDLDPGESYTIQSTWSPSAAGQFQVRAQVDVEGDTLRSQPLALTVLGDGTS